MPPPQRTAYFSSERRPGVVLRVSAMRVVVPATASTTARVLVAMPLRWPRMLRQVRSPVRIARLEPSSVASVAPAATRSPSADVARDGDVAVEELEHVEADVEAGDGAAARATMRPCGGCVVGNEGGAGEVAALGEVLDECALQHRVDLVGRRGHRSAHALGPRGLAIEIDRTTDGAGTVSTMVCAAAVPARGMVAAVVAAA